MHGVSPTSSQASTRVAAGSGALLIGVRYRVEGVLHEYLGPALLPGGIGIAHVFLRNEWRPRTPDQLPLTIIHEDRLGSAVAGIG